MKYPTFSDIKQFYDWGCYTDEEMREYVSINWITPAEYEEITGRLYDKPAVSVDLGTANTL
ncbi:XkdX family protein [Bacillus sonorensis]|uniref:XkdX family protein n=1 Tax=Bacillus sonorensis TaxID=119858 RepID=UPI00227DB164|nr:XkdX family protein [Bacillus sonorensis]MCY8025653.1 XkdX family protein [Bacillus sonorensis]MCY8087593.1 XkdX family protein [Bacillus sonorensis]MCY8271457.1 XkdX family protein [Bacillus sonorensis]MCY8603993.1 XkdX family protein [Bacillus sonorensis]